MGQSETCSQTVRPANLRRCHYSRRGLAAGACGASLEHAFEQASGERVLACSVEPNVRSTALMARLGFRQVGIMPAALATLRVFVRERAW